MATTWTIGHFKNGYIELQISTFNAKVAAIYTGGLALYRPRILTTSEHPAEGEVTFNKLELVEPPRGAGPQERIWARLTDNEKVGFLIKIKELDNLLTGLKKTENACTCDLMRELLPPRFQEKLEETRKQLAVEFAEYSEKELLKLSKSDKSDKTGLADPAVIDAEINRHLDEIEKLRKQKQELIRESSNE